MKPSVKVALVCSLISMGITMVFFYSGHSTLGFEMSVFINLFLLISSISVGVFLFKKSDGFADKSFLEDIKMAMQGGIMFTILVSGFTFFYHSKIDQSIFQEKVKVRIEFLHNDVPNEEAYIENIQKGNPTWQDLTYMDFLETQEDAIKGANSAKVYAIISSVAGMLLTIFFSIFTTIILRKIVLR